MVEATVAMTSRRDSNELPFVINLVANLVVNVTMPTEVQAEVDRLCQLSMVVHEIGGHPSNGVSNTGNNRRIHIVPFGHTRF